jgi:CubicO group peptidase (beta-lactamase class C family)
MRIRDTGALLAGILTRGTGTNLRDFADQHLFGPMGLSVGYWPRDPQGYCIGHGDDHCTPLLLASFGQMALDHGYWRGRPVLPRWWMEQSGVAHSAAWYDDSIWPYRDISYHTGVTYTFVELCSSLKVHGLRRRARGGIIFKPTIVQW